MTIKKLGPFVVLLSLSGNLGAQSWKPWIFQRHPYYDPLASEPRAAQMKVFFPGRASSAPYAVKPGQGMVWDISVGDEIPIVGWSSSSAQKEGEEAPARGWAVGVFFPLSFHMVEDMGKDESAPILNTDYRFGTMIKGQIGLPSKLWIFEDSHIGIRYVPLAHESTHLGDEFTLHATQKYGNNFRRVNVSYQYWELGGSFEPNRGLLEMKFRGGVIHEAFHKGIGWYDAALIQPVGGTVTLANQKYEPYTGVEAYYPPLLGGLFGSVDIRNRIVYNYDRPSRAVPEERQISVNALLGIRQQRPNSRIQPAYALRYYHGVNPAGQFRSQKNYQMYGLEISFQF